MAEIRFPRTENSEVEIFIQVVSWGKQPSRKQGKLDWLSEKLKPQQRPQLTHWSACWEGPSDRLNLRQEG